jgi:hypothetical protein
MKKDKNYHKKKALLEFAISRNEFSTDEAMDFLNSYKSKWNPNKIHRFTQTTKQQLGSLLMGNNNYMQLEKGDGRKTAKWIYVGEEE